MNPDYINLNKKVKNYHEVLKNTRAYRTIWDESLKDFIIKQLETISKEVNLEIKIETKSELENLEAIVLSLGDVKSGMYKKVNDSVKRHLIKHNGSLIYPCYLPTRRTKGTLFSTPSGGIHNRNF